MTLRFYNGEYRFVLVDTEVHGCTDVVRHMRWRCPSLSSINFITFIYLAILCFFVVTPKAVAQDTVAPLVSGNVTIDTTEMVTLYTIVTSTITEDVCQHSWNDIKSVCELPKNCTVPLSGTCSWRTDYVDHCRRSSSTKNCTRCLEEFLNLTEDVDGYYRDYTDVLERYDCKEQHDYNYSVWKCRDCELAYKDWLCATQIPHYYVENNNTVKIDPCEEFCERTEARCPYFLPQKPYCGQRTFFCRGPRENARYSKSKPDRCFTCNFSEEGDVAKSVADLGCSFYLVNSTETSAASFCHTRGSVYPVLVGLTLYILLSWTLSPTVVAGT